ncbi:Hsp20/alpha crystallin family protein [Mucilaginibacter sp.]|uniref:Hsp20/alpha crystallin family protein n=1 Tax=Mucilaginibacter sp. TaxID=1882438 RepID=UPI0032664911
MSDKSKGHDKIEPSAMENFFLPDAVLSPLSYAVNIREHDRKYELKIAAPGFKKSDFKVKTQGDILTITAETDHEENDTQKAFTRREFSRLSFARAFRLPENVITDDVSSRYHHGMLIVHLKKNERFLHGKKTIKTAN